MTQDEFKATGWTGGMKAEYKGKVYAIVACDFDEQLVALEGVAQGSDEPTWVRFENITLVD